MNVTQEDVARRAGVARKTVSNVITGYAHVRPAVRQRVLDAIAELGYQPNRAAQNLRTGRSGAIGLAVPELDISYFAELTRHVVEAAERHGLTVVIVQTLGSAERERSLLNAFSQRAIDGLIYSPIACSAEEITERPGRFPIVLLGEQITFPGLDHVGIDNVAAARTATDHLVSLGRTRIAFIGAGAATDSQMADQRLQGYREALAAAGLPLEPALIETVAGYHRPDGARAMSRLLTPDASRRPDAVFCANDLLAFGAMRAIADAGLRIPEDIAVVGFDGVEETAYSRPSLTSIAPDKKLIAETAVSHLIALINGGEIEEGDTLTDFSLQVRESSAGGR